MTNTDTDTLTSVSIKLGGSAKKLAELAAEHGFQVQTFERSLRVDKQKIILISNPEVGIDDSSYTKEWRIELWEGNGGNFNFNHAYSRNGLETYANKHYHGPYKAKDVERNIVAANPIGMRANRIAQQRAEAKRQQVVEAYKAEEDTEQRRRIRFAVDSLEADANKAIESFNTKYANSPESAISWELSTMVEAQAFKLYVLPGLRSEGYARSTDWTGKALPVEEITVVTLEEHVADYLSRLLDTALRSPSTSGGSDGHRIFEDAKSQAARTTIKKLSPLVGLKVPSYYT